LSNNLTPNLDECRLLIFKIIEQSIRDYLSLKGSSAPIEQEYYHTACEFLFNNNYYIDYGGIDLNLEDFLNILNIDLQWFREKIIKIKNQKIISFRNKRTVNEEDEQD
jgi:hypothetical protein